MTDATTQSPQSYDTVAKTLHWAIVILLLPMLYYGFQAHELPKADRLGFLQNHSGIGLIILLLMLARLAWRIAHPVPALPSDLPRWQRIASKASHHGLYLLVLLRPLLGLLLMLKSTQLFVALHLLFFDLFRLPVRLA